MYVISLIDNLFLMSTHKLDHRLSFFVILFKQMGVILRLKFKSRRILMTSQRVVILGGVLLALIFLLCFHMYSLSKQERLESLEKLSEKFRISQ